MIRIVEHLPFTCVVLLTVCCMLPATTSSQSTNGDLTLKQETTTSAGGVLGPGNPMRLATDVGEPIGGESSNSSCVLRASFPRLTASASSGSRLIAVDGTVNDPSSTVIVNSVSATMTGTTFHADNIRLFEGLNTITATATDPAGNRTTKTATVWLVTHPPARPTAGTPLSWTAAASYTISGTKTPGTSVWINGTQAVALNDATTWTASVSLTEGDNVLVVTTKDAAGNQSTAQRITIVLDNLPPVITATPPLKTNVNPFILTGTVDDSLTAVKANSITATRSGKTFEVPVPLTEGSNTISIIATSPNNLTSTKTVSITLGTVPTVTSIQPSQGTKPYVGDAVTLQATATDKEGDPLEYQIWLGGTLLRDWAPNATSTWTPANSQFGLQTVEIRARDGFGGYGSKRANVYVVYKPISPP